MPVAERAMRPRTVRLDPDADDYLKTLVPQKTGLGALISRLLLEHKLRAELTAQHQLAATREPWEHREHA